MKNVCYFLLLLSLVISSCGKKEDPAPDTSALESFPQTETISGIFPLEVYVPGVYVTNDPEKVGFCADREKNICMIIRYGNRFENNIPQCSVILPSNNSFANPTEKLAEVLSMQYEPTSLSANDLTNTFSMNADGNYSAKGISTKNNQNYLFNFNLKIN